MRCGFCGEELKEPAERCPKCGAAYSCGDDGGEGPVLAVHAADDLEADRIEAALSDSGIPVSRQYTGVNSWVKTVTGNSSGGVNLYVPKQAEEEAVEVLIGIGALESAEVQPEQTEGKEDMPPKVRAKSVVATLLLLLLIALLVFSVDGMMTLVNGLFGGK